MYFSNSQTLKTRDKESKMSSQCQTNQISKSYPTTNALVDVFLFDVDVFRLDVVDFLFDVVVFFLNVDDVVDLQ